MTLMRYSILFILTAFALLAGCKKDEEEDLQQESKTTVLSFEDKVREVYDYPISVKLPARGDLDCTFWMNIKVKGEDYSIYIDRPITFEGLAADFILENSVTPTKIKQEASEGWFSVVRVKYRDGQIVYCETIDVMNQETNYSYYFPDCFQD